MTGYHINRIVNDTKKDTLFNPTKFPHDPVLPQEQFASSIKYILIIKVELQKKIENHIPSYTLLECNFFQLLTYIDLSGLPESISDYQFLEFLKNVQREPSFMANNENNVSDIEVLSSIISNDLTDIESVHSFMTKIVSKKEEILQSIQNQLSVHQGIQNKMLVLLSKVSKTNDRMERKLNNLQHTTCAKLNAKKIITELNFPYKVMCYQQFSNDGSSVRFEINLNPKKEDVHIKKEIASLSAIGRFLLIIKKLRIYFKKLVSTMDDEYGYKSNKIV